MSEFHDLAELAINREGQSWGNLGYWKTATEYSDACRALALLLGEEAGLDRQSLVFDAGFGCGDQLLLWLDHFGVSRIYGANLSRSQTAYAKNLLAQNRHPGASRAIIEGDINDPDIWTIVLDGSTPSHVLALDCAYHFPDRSEFLRLAHQHLAPMGRLALTDFMLSDRHETGSLRHRLLRWMLKKSHIAETNIVHRDVYLRQIQQSGFGEIRITDISEHVMPAFSAAGGGKTGWSGRMKYAVTSLFLKWAYHRSVLRYYVVSATITS